MSFACYLIAVICAVLAAFGVHASVTLPLAVAFIAAGLLLVAAAPFITTRRA